MLVSGKCYASGRKKHGGKGVKVASENNVLMAKVKCSQGKRFRKKLKDISFLSNLPGSSKNVVGRAGEVQAGDQEGRVGCSVAKRNGP